jgi:hypothetical protein
VEGRIASLDMEVQQLEREVLYIPKLRYRYQVAGKEYEGSRIDLTSQRKFYRQGAANAVLLEYDPDGPVKVYYNPRRPAESLLKPGVSAATWMVAGLVVLLLALLAAVGLPGYL